MYAIHNNIGGHRAAGQHRAQQSGIAMIQRSHRVKRVRSMPRARLNGGPSLRQISIRVAQADTNPSPAGFGNQVEGAFDFRSDGHYADASVSRVPHPLEQLARRWLQQRRRMNSALRMTQKRPFEEI